jgi:rhamnosyltransferase
MKFSIIIPTYNAGKKIERLLESIKIQTLQPEEVVVIDSESVDETLEIVERYKYRIIRIKHYEFDHGKTRYLAAKETKGEYLVFLTQYVELYNEKVLDIIFPVFEKDKFVKCAFGRQVPRKDSSIFAQYLRYFNYPSESYIRSIEDKYKYGFRVCFLSNSFAVYERMVLEEIGWFKENLIFGEDTHAAGRILLRGYKIAYVAEAMVYHSHDYTIVEEFRRYFDIGVFHKQENWLLREFGKVNNEGTKYIILGIKYVFERKEYFLIFEFLIRVIMKYIGYVLGTKYSLFPIWFVKIFSMNKDWSLKSN